MFWRRKKPEMNGAAALEEAKHNLELAKKDRGDVQETSRTLRLHRMENHISQRILLVLKEQ